MGIVASMEPTTENLDDILKKLLAAIPEVKAAAIVSTEGLPIASALPPGIDETRFAAMSAALLSLAERTVTEMKKGEFNQLYVKGSDGYLLILQAGPSTVLTVSTTKNVRLGLIFLDLKRKFGNGEGLTPFPIIPPGGPGPAGSAKRKEIPAKMEAKAEFEPYCKHCGAILPKGQTICHACGKKVI